MTPWRVGDGGDDDDDDGGSLWLFLWCVLIYDDGVNQNHLRTNRIMDQRVSFVQEPEKNRNCPVRCKY